jgi:membrane protease YdiL (CAAX protease family)
MSNPYKNIVERHSLIMFFFLAYIISWLIFGLGIAANLDLTDFRFDGTVLTILGGLGPLVSAIVVIRVTEGRSGVRNLLKSVIDWRVKVKWWMAGVGLLAGLFAISAGLNELMGGSAPSPDLGLYLNGGNFTHVILLLLFGSFTEEPGWRGFALPRLQQKHSPLKATLILTVFWWLWHLPTYWIMPAFIGAVQQFGFVAAYGIQLVVLLALSFLCTWVYNGSGGSVLMPVLMHASWNFWSGAFGQDASLFLMPMFLLTAIVIIFATRNKLGLTEG